MPRFEFPYITQPYIDNTGKLVQEYRPYVPIVLTKNRKSTASFYALLDSGADFNLFPASILRSLDINLHSGKQRQVYGIGDHKVLTYTHTIHLTVGKYTFSTKIDFSEQQFVPLLGRKGFFDKLKQISFLQKKRLIKFEY